MPRSPLRLTRAVARIARRGAGPGSKVLKSSSRRHKRCPAIQGSAPQATVARVRVVWRNWGVMAAPLQLVGILSVDPLTVRRDLGASSKYVVGFRHAIGRQWIEQPQHECTKSVT
jgi:hypothetical protein